MTAATLSLANVLYETSFLSYAPILRKHLWCQKQPFKPVRTVRNHPGLHSRR
jgi:hypothetical protein